jgi:hypothetical protein
LISTSHILPFQEVARLYLALICFFKLSIPSIARLQIWGLIYLSLLIFICPYHENFETMLSDQDIAAEYMEPEVNFMECLVMERKRFWRYQVTDLHEE